MAADWKAINRNWDELKGLKLLREGELQQIADVFMPRKTFVCTPVPGELRKRRVTTSVPQMELARCATMVAAYLFDPTRPNIKPNATPGLIAAGRRTLLEPPAQDYLDDLSWSMFDCMMLPKSGFFGSLSRVALELVGFGTAVMWCGRKRGFGPKYQARSIRNCWIAQNDDQEVDTLYYRWTAPAWRVVQRYPEAGKVEGIRKLAGDDKTASTLVTLLHVVEPRGSGKAGAVATNLPFASVVMAPDFKDAILEESGFEIFPFGVPRLNVEDESAYGTGLAWTALPEAMVLNMLQQMVEKGVGGRVDPPAFVPARLFGKPIDRRPGALNVYDEAGLGFQQLKDAIQYIQTGGDVGIGVDYMRMCEERIGRVFLTDWMKLRDSGAVTAEEVIERRNLRVRSMGAFMPSVDRDLMGVIGDRTLSAMVEEDQVPAPPDQLAAVDIAWDYAGPLAIAQQQGQVEAINKMMLMAQSAMAVDPDVVACLAMEEGLRAAGEAMAAPPALFRSRAQTAETRAALQQARIDAAQAEQAAKLGGAFRDGAQGAAQINQAQMDREVA